jgi:hypothetical protein
MRFAGVYGIAVGLLMLAQWAAFILRGQVPEMRTEPIRLGFHLAAEFMTALGLAASGFGVLRRATWATGGYLVSSGMLVYSVIVSPGYFAQQGQWAFVVMFGILLVAAAASIRAVLRGARPKAR